MNKKSFFVALFLVISLSGCVSVPERPTTTALGDYEFTKSYVSWLAKKSIDEHGIPGLSIALVDDQKIIWQQGFGFADVKSKTPATEKTIYRVGSIAKLFTDSAAMKLAEENKINIDAPLVDVLPKFTIKNRFTNAGAVTPRSIMTHHSGLPADMLQGMWTEKSGERFTEVVDILKDEYMAYPPNFIYSYSNVALSLLGHAVQEASGQKFEDYVDQALIKPLGMTHTGFFEKENFKSYLANGYADGKEINPGQIRDRPAGGLYSNVTDLSRLLSMVFAEGKSVDGKQVLQAKTINEMIRRQNADVPLDFNFDIGLGWFLIRQGIDGSEKVISHGGGTPCFFSQMIGLPEHKLGVVVLANSCSAGSTVADVGVAALKLALEAKTGFRQSLETKIVKAPIEENPSKEQLDNFTGRYATWAGLIDVTREDEHLNAKISGWNFDLIPLTDGKFGIQFKLFGLFNIRYLFGIDLENVTLQPVDVGKRKVAVMRFKGRDQIFGERITQKPIPESWLARLGELDVQGQDKTMKFSDTQLVNDNGILVMKYKLKMTVLPEQHAKLPIQAISDNEAIILGLGRGMGETVRIVHKEGKEILRFSGYDAVWTHYDNSLPFANRELAKTRFQPGISRQGSAR